MPRKERFPHYCKTRKEHKCERCGNIIPRGVRVRYRNLFTGKRGYYHLICPGVATMHGDTR